MLPTAAEKDTYRIQIASELKRRQVSNSRYSLRSFSKCLGVTPSFLSKVLKGERNLSAQRAVQVAERLGYSPQGISEFCQLVQLEGASSPGLKRAIQLAKGNDEAETAQLLNLDAFSVISDWYHYAILNLTKCISFRSDPSWIARRLGISAEEARAAIVRLLRLGLLTHDRGTLKMTDALLATPTDFPSQPLRNFHLQMISKAKDALEKQSVKERDITSISIPIDPTCLPAAKREIKAFRRRMDRLFESQRAREVYQLNIQFFRLTQNE